jgi:large subunit ribosomal protein L23
MKTMQLHEIIKRPLITEKNATLQPNGKYVFKVGARANKMQIKNAVEEAFKVTVTGVNVITIHSKEKRVGRRLVVTSPWKKAIVTLKAGDKIDLFESL